MARAGAALSAVIPSRWAFEAIGHDLGARHDPGGGRLAARTAAARVVRRRGHMVDRHVLARPRRVRVVFLVATWVVARAQHTRLPTRCRPVRPARCTKGSTLMNPNQALWEKGDFTRIAEACARAARRSSRSSASPRDAGARPRMRRRHDRAAGGAGAAPTCSASTSPATSSTPGTARPRTRASTNCRFQKATHRTSRTSSDDRFDLVVSIFGAMFAPKPFDVAKEMVRVTRPGGRIVMGNWIPNDPTLVAQILKISAAYSPPPPEGFVSPMTWGVEEQRDRAVRRGRRPARGHLVRRGTPISSTSPARQPNLSPSSGTTTGRR